MTLRMGTRQLQGFRKEHPHTSSLESGMTRDVGLGKLVTASATFTANNGRITGANGTFSAFAAGDPILIQGSNLNDGERIATGIDAVHGAYLVLDSAPKNEGPISVTVRTP